METGQSKTFVWDLFIRIFHWALAVCVPLSFVSVKMNWMTIHFISGATILGLLLFRVMWGVIGTSTARFRQFFPSPSRIKAWRSGNQIGHSPHGALSVFALLILLTLQTATGLFVDDEIYLTGPLRDLATSSQSRMATKLHGRVADLLLMLVVLHVAAVAFYVFVRKKNIIVPMLHGHAATGAAKETATSVPVWRGLVAVVVAFGIVLSVFG